MNTMTHTELAKVVGGEGALTSFGANVAADGLQQANSTNPVLAGLGLLVAAGGAWTWAFGSFFDGLSDLF